MEDVDNHPPGLHSPVAYIPSGAHHAMGAQDTFLLALNGDEKKGVLHSLGFPIKELPRQGARVSPENSTQHSHPLC